MKKSLLSQIVLLVTLVIIINLAGFLTALRLTAVTPAAEHIADLVSNQLSTLEALSDRGSFTGLEALLEAASLDQEIVVRYVAPDPIPSPIPFYQILSERLQRQASLSISPIHSDRGQDPRLWVKPYWAGRAWLGFEFPTYSEKGIFGIMFTIMVTVIISALLGVAYARHISQSLTQLGRVASDIYTGKSDASIPMAGPQEVQQLTTLVHDSAKRVQELAEYRKMLLAGISHDLRTPLSRIRIALEMLENEELRDGMVSDVEEIDNTIGDFIQYVRDGEEESVQLLDLKKLLREIADQCLRTGKHLILLLGEPECFVSARPNAIRRALDNLVGNAFRHGKPPVSCGLSSEHGMVHIAIRDHGPGINEQLLPLVIEPFAQGESARTRLGSGLGLAIVNRIAEKHSGCLRLSNVADGGLRATLVLPGPETS